MKPEEITAVVQGIVPAVREFVAEGMGKVSGEVRALEQRIEGLPDHGTMLGDVLGGLAATIQAGIAGLPVPDYFAGEQGAEPVDA